MTPLPAKWLYKLRVLKEFYRKALYYETKKKEKKRT